jgi:hypothetical protein
MKWLRFSFKFIFQLQAFYVIEVGIEPHKAEADTNGVVKQVYRVKNHVSSFMLVLL